MHECMLQQARCLRNKHHSALMTVSHTAAVRRSEFQCTGACAPPVANGRLNNKPTKAQPDHKTLDLKQLRFTIAKAGWCACARGVSRRCAMFTPQAQAHTHTHTHLSLPNTYDTVPALNTSQSQPCNWILCIQPGLDKHMCTARAGCGTMPAWLARARVFHPRHTDGPEPTFPLEKLHLKINVPRDAGKRGDIGRSRFCAQRDAPSRLPGTQAGRASRWSRRALQ